MTDDYIKRDDAIETVYHIRKKPADDEWAGKWLTPLQDIPSADVRENVKGEWIEDNSREKSMMWRCSVCGQIAYYPTIGKRKGFKKHCGYNYCPNCGADMRGEA